MFGNQKLCRQECIRPQSMRRTERKTDIQKGKKLLLMQLMTAVCALKQENIRIGLLLRHSLKMAQTLHGTTETFAMEASTSCL